MADTTYRGKAFERTKLLSEHPEFRYRMRRRIRNLRRAIYSPMYWAVYRTVPRLPFWLITLLVRMVVTPVSRMLLWRTAEENLIKVYGTDLDPKERRRILSAIFRGIAASVLECIGAVKFGPRFVLDRTEDASARKLVADLEAGSERGWIGVTPHLANWILLASWTGAQPGGRGLCHAIAKRQPNPQLSALLDDAFRRMAFVPIYSDGPPLQVVGECLKLLRRGGRLGIAPDQDMAKMPGVFVDFLGHPAYTPTGPAQMALAAGVPIVPLALVRTHGGKRFEIIHGEPIYPDNNRTGSRQDEMLRLTRAWTAAMETMIHAHKDQWAWFHRRWKTTPEKLVALGRAHAGDDAQENGAATAAAPGSSANAAHGALGSGASSA